MGLERAARVLSRVGVLVVAAPFAARAEGAPSIEARPMLGAMHTHNVAGLAVILGLILFATILSLVYLRERVGWMRKERALQDELTDLRGAHDRAEMLLHSERQVLVAWAGRGEPMIVGDPAFAQDLRNQDLRNPDLRNQELRGYEAWGQDPQGLRAARGTCSPSAPGSPLRTRSCSRRRWRPCASAAPASG